MIDPFNQAEQYNYIVFGGVKSPLIQGIKGHDYELDWEISKPKGSSGHVMKLHGRKVSPYVVTHLLADAEDFTAWEKYERVLKSTVSGTVPTALPIFHPDLSRNSITESSLSKISGFEHAQGGVRVSVTLFRYEPSKPKPVEAMIGGVEFGEATIENDPNAARRARNAQLREEAAKL